MPPSRAYGSGAAAGHDGVQERKRWGVTLGTRPAKKVRIRGGEPKAAQVRPAPVDRTRPPGARTTRDASRSIVWLNAGGFPPQRPLIRATTGAIVSIACSGTIQ